ncbi:hypothetical protein ACWEP3_26040, partial [Streptomyces albidoflavus]
MVGQRGHDTVLGTAGTPGAGARPVTAEPGAVRGVAPEPPARPRRPRPWALRAPRRMASQVLLVQLVIAVGVTPLSHQPPPPPQLPPTAPEL